MRPRRQFLALGAAGLGTALLAGCDRLSQAPDFEEFLSSAEWFVVVRQMFPSQTRARKNPHGRPI
jgi:hypothetical protein